MSLAFGLAVPTAGAKVASSTRIAEKAWTGSVVVGVAAGTIEAVENRVVRAGGTVIRRSGPGAFLVADAPEGEDPAAFAASVSRLPGVEYAEPESRVTAAFVPDDPDFGLQWNLERIGAPDAWDITQGSREVRIAVVDSGVDLDHPDLEGRIDTSRGYDFIGRDAVADDGFGHGTHVAGVLAAATDNGSHVAGIAGECVLIPVRVLDRWGNGETSTMAEGIRYAADQGADVINVSAGGPDDARVLSDAVDYAVSKGCVVVAAAGNRGIAGLDYPAAYPDVVSVGAVDETDASASFSRFGDRLDMVAPGVAVHSLRPITGAADSGTGVMSGTSMATPHVAGVAALLRSANPTWTAGMVIRRLMDTAEDLGPMGKDPRFGFGLVRADRALGEDPEAPSDDEFPGIPLTTATHDGVVDEVTDPVDVLSIALAAGQEIRLWFKGSETATISLTLYDPSGESTALAAPLVSVLSTGTSVRLDYAVPDEAEGVYRIVVSAEEGGGAYSLAWEKGRPTNVAVSAPKTCAWGGSVFLSGSVKEADGQPVTRAGFIVDRRPAGSSGWTLGIASGSLNAFGGFRVSVKPARQTRYRVRFEGAPGRFESVSRTVEVTPRAQLSPPVPVGSVRRGVAFTVAGTLKPTYDADGVVRVVLAELQGARYVSRRTVRAEASQRDGATRYTARLTVPGSGKWRITASVPASTRHAATTSRAVYLTVP